MADVNDRRQVERSARVEKGIRGGELRAVKEVMASPRGRAFVQAVLDKTGVERMVSGPALSNAMALARDVGLQELGKWLLGEIREACPEQELVMRAEQRARDQRVDDENEVNQ